MSGISTGFGRVLDCQANLAPVTTISGTPVTLFTYSFPIRFTLGPGQGVLVQAIWQHTTGATSTTYTFGTTSIGASTSTAAQSLEVYCVAQTSGIVSTNGSFIIGNAGSAAGGRTTFHSGASIPFTGALTLALTANAASNTDVITPIFWLVTEVK